jgi:hypothetical protein
LELTDVWRHGGSLTAQSIVLQIDLLLQSVATEGVSCAFVVGARYVERVATGTRLDLEVSN